MVWGLFCNGKASFVAAPFYWWTIYWPRDLSWALQVHLMTPTLNLPQVACVFPLFTCLHLASLKAVPLRGPRQRARRAFENGHAEASTADSSEVQQFGDFYTNRIWEICSIAGYPKLLSIPSFTFIGLLPECAPYISTGATPSRLLYGWLLLLANLYQQGHSFSQLPKYIKVISDGSSLLDKETMTEAVMNRFDALADSIPKALEHIKKAHHRYIEAYAKKRKYAIS